MSPGEPSGRRRIVAIDGAAGAGKSTLARALARELDVAYVNTGAMYRSLARRALDRGIDPSDEAALVRLATELRFSLGDGSPPELEVDGAPPGPELVRPDVEDVVSQVSRHPAVRAWMVEEQRRLGADGGVIEGRDIGSVVFPRADVKIFLDASPEVRATRRALEREASGDGGPPGALERRNELDARTVPHEPTSDALVIDTTELDARQVLRRAVEAVHGTWRGEEFDRPMQAPGGSERERRTEDEGR